MPTPTIPQLGASTVTRKWVYQANLGTLLVPTWTTVGGITSQKFSPDEANWVDDTDNSNAGVVTQTKTAAGASITMTLSRKVVPGTVTYDPAQEYLRTMAIGKFGPANTVQMRIFEYDPNDAAGAYTPRVEAYLGLFGVQYDPQGGDPKAIDTVNLTMPSQGQFAAISHPYPAVAVVPTITSATPNTGLLAAGGDLVDIRGTGFTGTVPTSGVKFGTTNATKWDVISDGIIVAVAPAHTAGTVTVVVTNATGASTSAVSATFV